jgi:ArsR family transcriptional regulator
MASIMKLLRVLADPTRLRLVLLLAEEELTVAEMQEILGMAQSRISAALGQLKREGLASDRRVGKNIFYSSKGGAPKALEGLLAAARADLPEASRDQAALALTLRKRKDRAGEYFNRLAGRFGKTYVPGRSWQALAHALLRLLPPMVIADLGAGEGTLSQLLARSAKRVIAVDNSEKMVEFGSAIAREHGFKNLEYRLGEIEDPPIEEGSVDLALFSQALHHAASPQRAVTAAQRLLKPGGRIVILDLLSHTFEQTRELYAHVWLGFSEIELHQLLRKAGFSKIEITIVSREPEPPHFQTLLATGIKARIE